MFIIFVFVIDKISARQFLLCKRVNMLTLNVKKSLAKYYKKLVLITLLPFGLLLNSCNKIQDPVYTGLNGYQEKTTTSIQDSTEVKVKDGGNESENLNVEENSSVLNDNQVLSNELYDSSDYKFYMDSNLSLVLSKSSSDKTNYCLMTFDNVPNGNSLKIADALEENGIRAIFFISGNNLEDEQSRTVVKNLFERGHSIACNGRRGINLRGLSKEEQSAEILDNVKQIEAITGVRPRFYRNPQSEFDDTTIEICKENNLINMSWSYSYDWMDSYQDKDSLVNVILNQTPLINGMNILFHDLPWTAEAMPEIISGIKDKKFVFVNPKEIGPSNESSRSITYYNSANTTQNVEAVEENKTDDGIKTVEAPTIKNVN